MVNLPDQERSPAEPDFTAIWSGVIRRIRRRRRRTKIAVIGASTALVLGGTLSAAAAFAWPDAVDYPSIECFTETDLFSYHGALTNVDMTDPIGQCLWLASIAEDDITPYTDGRPRSSFIACKIATRTAGVFAETERSCSDLGYPDW